MPPLIGEGGHRFVSDTLPLTVNQLNLADLALGQKLNRIIKGKTYIITQKEDNLPNFIAVKYS